MDLSLVFEACVAAVTLMITAGVCASLGRWVVREATGADETRVTDEEERRLLEEHRKKKNIPDYEHLYRNLAEESRREHERERDFNAGLR